MYKIKVICVSDAEQLQNELDAWLELMSNIYYIIIDIIISSSNDKGYLVVIIYETYTGEKVKTT